MDKAPARNAPCPCGSGRKYMQCCAAAAGGGAPPLRSPGARRAAAGLFLAALVAGSVFAFKRLRPGAAADAPDFRAKGPADAPVVVVEYSDFQCPACRAGQESLRRLLARYGDRVRLEYKHFPLENIHRWARAAALSAECAGERGKFWEMHDLLFERQPLWSRDFDAESLFAGYAGELGLEKEPFRRCVRSQKAAAAVARDAEEARARPVNSTPTYFINGKRFVGAGQLGSGGFAEVARLLGS